MIVKCIYNKNNTIPSVRLLNRNLLNAQFDLQVGKSYRIFAQSSYQGVINYLLDPDHQYRPNWYPAEIFIVQDGQVPAHWLFSFRSELYKEDVGAIWGYKEIVNNDRHYNGILERDPRELSVFRAVALRFNNLGTDKLT